MEMKDIPFGITVWEKLRKYNTKEKSELHSGEPVSFEIVFSIIHL